MLGPVGGAPWKGDDTLRPLSKVGRRQAAGLVDAAARPRRSTNSCPVRTSAARQTLDPLANDHDCSVETADGLREGARLDEALRLLEKVSHQHTVLCTHGDVVEMLLRHLKAQGIKIGKLRFEKGSIWALETRGGTVTKATYLPPPSSER